jgi:hypothetical protein
LSHDDCTKISLKLMAFPRLWSVCDLADLGPAGVFGRPGRPGLLCLVGEVDDGFGTVVPAPWDVEAVQVHAADPPVDPVEGAAERPGGSRRSSGFGPAAIRSIR